MATEKQLLKTPLYQKHLDHNARMVNFGGWQMPVQYEGILAEYHQTRNYASLFDISHMGEFIIEGDCRQCGLDRVVTMSLTDCPVGRCRYGMMLNDQGGVIDDLIVFRLEKKKWFIVVNAATTQKDIENFTKHLSPDAVFTDVSMQTGKLDVQGPQSRKILKKFIPDIEKLDYYMFDFFDLLNEHVLVSRTGYTGELGYEIYYPWEKTKILWDELLKNEQIKPAGLGARDVLRLEMGYSLYGHELTEGVSALESGLGRFIDFEKDFVGKQALVAIKEKGTKRKIVGFLSETRRSPREGQPVFDSNGNVIGIVTSGTFSPSQNKGIGLGFVDVACAERGKEIFIGSEKSRLKAAVCSRIFYQKGSLKN